ADISGLVEHPANAAVFAERAAGAGEHGTDLADGPVAIVGHRLDYHRDPAGPVSLVGNLVVVRAAFAAAGPGDRPVDIVLRHVFVTCLLDGEPQPRVRLRVRHAGPGGDGD